MESIALTPTHGVEAPKLPPKPVVVPKPTNSTLDRIRACESQNNPNARNPHSTAKGLYQFLNSSWIGYGTELWGSLKGKDVFNPVDNQELAEYVYKKYGTSPWNSSKYCWS